MAEYFLKNYISCNNIDNILCESAGIFAQDGNSASENAIEAMREIGIDIAKHRSRKLKFEELKDYDILVVMNKNMKEYLVNNGVIRYKIYVLGGIDGIADPYLKNLGIYKKIRDDIKYSIRGLLVYIKKIKAVFGFKILKADIVHVPFLNSLERLCYSDPWSCASIEDEIRNKNSFFIVAEWDSRVIAYACLRLFEYSAEIMKVTTDVSFRGFGVAKTLVERLLKFAREKGVKQVLLEVRKSNSAAFSLYRNCGFEVISIRRNFYSSPVEDAFSMRKILS